MVDSRGPFLTGGIDSLDKYYINLSAELYLDDAEEIDTKIPYPKIDELEITAFVDSYHAHEK